MAVVSFSSIDYDEWRTLGNEKYVLFILISYLLGVVFQEIGTILDNKFLCKLIYGGTPRELLTLQRSSDILFEDKIASNDIEKVEQIIQEYYGVSFSSFTDKKKASSTMFAYCLNISEMQHITEKSDKMGATSEMSRSIFWGCIATIFINIFLIHISDGSNVFLLREIPLLISLAAIFFVRKVRYEKYRIRILIRNFLIYHQRNNIEKRSEGK